MMIAVMFPVVFPAVEIDFRAMEIYEISTTDGDWQVEMNRLKCRVDLL